MTPDDRSNNLSSDPGALMSAAGPASRPPSAPSAPTAAQSPDDDRPPISPLNPESMHRADQDAEVRATSPEFHDRLDGATIEPPPRPDGA